MQEKLLLFSDLHCPYHHKDAFRFLSAIKEKYKPTKVFCLGDEVDSHVISFHDTDPDLSYSASSELKTAIRALSTLYDVFPQLNILESNHGSLVYRRAKKFGIPVELIRPWNEILGAPNSWKWSFDYTYKMSNGQNLYLHHGISTNAQRVAWEKQCSYAQGHYHSQLSSTVITRRGLPFWSATIGCLIDHDSLAFAYQRNNLKRPQLGCMIIIDGYPQIIPMRLNKRKRWVGKL